MHRLPVNLHQIINLLQLFLVFLRFLLVLLFWSKRWDDLLVFFGRGRRQLALHGIQDHGTCAIGDDGSRRLSRLLRAW